MVTRRWPGRALTDVILRWWRNRKTGRAVLDAAGPTRTVLLVSTGLSLTIAALVWVGYVATAESRRGTDLLIESREAEALALTSAAINRDMKGAWTTVLAPINRAALEEAPPFDVMQRTAKAFARFPYPEFFVVWKRAPTDVTYALYRSDRIPRWDDDEKPADPIPVVLKRNPAQLRKVVERLERVGADRPFVSFDLDIDGVPYQLIAHVLFATEGRHEAVAAFGFMVNLDWVRHDYFGPLLQQVARIGGNEAALSLTVADDTGGVVATTGPASAAGHPLQRRFPLAFLDPALLSEASSQRLARTAWTVKVQPAPNSAGASAQSAMVRLFALLAVAAAASVVALLVTVRAVQVNAHAASMKSDFVAAVTHDLKTPLSLIRLVADTLARGRYTSTVTVEEYAGLLSQEASRLTRSIDSLLTYSRYADWSHAHINLAPVDMAEIIEDALEEFRPVLIRRGFELELDVPSTLPRVAADPRAMIQVAQSIVDNAIKYSPEYGSLRIVGHGNRSSVVVTFSDRGVGISEEDLEHVCERFYRGRNVKDPGSGLGLAIASRIVAYHRGHIAIRSTVGVGTEVELSFPIATAS